MLDMSEEKKSDNARSDEYGVWTVSSGLFLMQKLENFELRVALHYQHK
jgi:hypothetical protein